MADLVEGGRSGTEMTEAAAGGVFEQLMRRIREVGTGFRVIRLGQGSSDLSSISYDVTYLLHPFL